METGSVNLGSKTEAVNHGATLKQENCMGLMRCRMCLLRVSRFIKRRSALH